jgi:hypothetical protein
VVRAAHVAEMDMASFIADAIGHPCSIVGDSSCEAIPAAPNLGIGIGQLQLVQRFHGKANHLRFRSSQDPSGIEKFEPIAGCFDEYLSP